MELIHTDGAPAAIGPYSQAIKVGGLLYCSGQIGLPAGTGGDLVPGGVEAEARQSLSNLKAVLEAGGASLSTVVKTTVFLQRMEDFPLVNGIYAEFFADHRPARACVAVSQLPKGAQFEIDAVAALIEG